MRGSFQKKVFILCATRPKHLDLSLVTDASSRKIMGQVLSREMKDKHMVKALEKTASVRITSKPLVHHFDKKLQYCAGEYQARLNKHGIRPSRTGGYDCYQNAFVEQVNDILKQEFLLEK